MAPADPPRPPPIPDDPFVDGPFADRPFAAGPLDSGPLGSGPFAPVPPAEPAAPKPPAAEPAGFRRPAFAPGNAIPAAGFAAPDRDPFERIGAGATGGYRSDLFGEDALDERLDNRHAGAAAGPFAGYDSSASRGDPAIDKAFALAALNPLVGAASPLLWLAGRLNESGAPDDAAALRDAALEETRRFEAAAMAQGIPSRIVRIARYMLAATVDDIVLNTPWGGQSGWASRSLVGVLYDETWGGERFYDLLSQTMLSPADNIDVLELAAICLSIGFVGKFRIVEGGAGQLTRLRHDLYRTVRRIRGPYDRSLSGGWVPLPVPHRPLPSLLGFWLCALVLAVALAALWSVCSLMLRARVDAAAAELRALVPAGPVLPVQPAIPVIVPPAAVPLQTQIERISGKLEDDLAAGRVEVAATGDSVTVRMLMGAFPTAGTVLTREALPVVARIALALEDEAGPITVTGHTDNQPVAPGSPIGDNLSLSLGRARAAAEAMQRFLSQPTRVSFRGAGDSQPIASNASREGRARNRRVDFQIPAEPARESIHP